MHKNSHYHYLYLSQFIAALLVVIVHCGTLTDIPIFHFLIKSSLCRLAVPFFIVNNAFFFRQKDRSQQKTWFKQMIRIYLFWSIIYLPLGLQLIQEQFHLAPILYLPALFIGLIYLGTYYHLWYFPALLFSLFIVPKLLKKIGYLKSCLLFSSLFLIGSVETYSAYITHPVLKQLITNYFSIFMTTRNGLFFSSIFVLIGFFIADHQEKLAAHRKNLLIGFFATIPLFFVEGFAVYTNQGLDKNFFFYLIPISFFGFSLLIQPSRTFSFSYLKKYGQAIFFLHLIPIEIFNKIIPHGYEITPFLGWCRLFLGIIVPVIMLVLVEKLKTLYTKEIFLQKIK